MDDLAYVNSVSAGAHPNSFKPEGKENPANGVTTSKAAGDFSIEELRETLNEALKVASTNSEEDIANLDDEAIALLLGKLDQADHVTAGLEDKLDALLGQLDGMIESMQQLEGNATTQKAAEAAQQATKAPV